MPASRTSTSRLLSFDRSRHAAPQVFERLRDMILSLELAPGTLLSRAELAAQFGLSQTPIRDALIKLGEEGLVDIFPQHATVVSRIDAAAATQAQFLRRSIEAEVVRTLASHAGVALIDQLRAQIDVQAALMGSAAYLEFIAADRAFHRLMYVAAGVPDLFDLVRQRSGHVDRLRMLNLARDGMEGIVDDPATIGEQIRTVERELKETVEGYIETKSSLATLDGYIAQIDEVFSHPEQHVTLTQSDLRLDRMGIKVDDGTDERHNALTLAELKLGEKLRAVVALVRCPRSELPPKEDMIANAERYL